MVRKLIDADVVIKHIEEYWEMVKRGKPSRGMTAVMQNIKTIVNSLQTVDAETVRHGKWEPCCEWHGTNGEIETRAYACSECNVIIPVDIQDVRFLRGCFLRYCPQCGARMDK